MRLATVVCVIGMLAASVSALTVPNIFSNGMILQTNSQYGARAFVYGYAQPGEQITLAGAPRRSVFLLSLLLFKFSLFVFCSFAAEAHRASRTTSSPIKMEGGSSSWIRTGRAPKLMCL